MFLTQAQADALFTTQGEVTGYVNGLGFLTSAAADAFFLTPVEAGALFIDSNELADYTYPHSGLYTKSEVDDKYGPAAADSGWQSAGFSAGTTTGWTNIANITIAKYRLKAGRVELRWQVSCELLKDFSGNASGDYPDQSILNIPVAARPTASSAPFGSGLWDGRPVTLGLTTAGNLLISGGNPAQSYAVNAMCQGSMNYFVD